MNETAMLQALLNHDSVGWIGWTVVISVVVTVALGFITKGLFQVIKNVKSIRAEVVKTDYKKQIKCESNINELLRTIKHEMHADAVMVLQYHNGVHSIANNSLLRISATHESITQMSPSYLGVIDSWMANFMGSWNKLIFDGRYIAIEDFSKEELDQDLLGLQQWLAKIHCKSIYLFPVQDAYGATFGIGVICHTSKPVVHSSEFLSWAKGRFNAIGALLAGIDK